MSITAAEQYLIELINRARLDPLAEAQRFGVDLNENLAPGTITASQKQALAPNQLLESAAQAHSLWLLQTNAFSHTGAGGSTVPQRIEAAGYQLSGSWRSGENLAFSASTAAIDLGQKIGEHHEALFLSAGHRRNTLDNAFREIGVAQEQGAFRWGGHSYNNTSMLTVKFATSGTAVFVTGVFYADLDGNDFYDIGEGVTGSVGIAGVTVQTGAAGGYAIAAARAPSVAVTLSGGGGSGVVEVDTTQGNVKLDLVDGAHVLSAADARLVSGFATATLLGIADTTLTGNAMANVLTGNRGDNILSGEAGDDTLYGGLGNDTLYGGAGSDELHGGAGDDLLDGGFREDILYGGEGRDILYGGAGLDTLIGGGGNDTLYGGADQDTLIGGPGADFMDGGDGSDVYFVDGDDTIHDSGTVGYDRAQINDPGGIALNRLAQWSGVDRVNGFTGNDTLDASGSTQGWFLFGHDGDDLLRGGAGSDTLLGGDGDDVIHGGDGNDILQGGRGNDTFYGGAGDDLIYVGESGDFVADAGPGFDRVLINNPDGLHIAVGAWQGVERIVGYIGDDLIDATGATLGIIFALNDGDDTLIGGEGDDTVYAGLGDDLVFGGAGDDALIGGPGDDTLVGGTGDDFLLGGAGADVFVFGEGFGRDVIRDFTRGEDRMDFTGHSAVNALGDLIIAQAGAHTVITLAAAGHQAEQITLTDLDAAYLGTEDFIFA